MQVNWCFKGIQESASFDDAQASAVLTETGIISAWMIANCTSNLALANVESQNALSPRALDLHVNSYWPVARDTPYISLSAGCVEYQGDSAPPIRYAALRTALDFATDGGNSAGYVFRCWVITGIKPAAELLGLAEEIRDLNQFAGFYRYHYEGEVAAKLVVPRRQVQWVQKVGPDLRAVAASWTSLTSGTRALRNVDFVWPHRVSNLIEAIY